MSGHSTRLVQNCLFEFSGLSGLADESFVVRQRFWVGEATEGTLHVAVHSAAIPSTAAVSVLVEALLPSEEEPAIEFVGRTIAEAEITVSEVAPTLVSAKFGAPWGSWVRISVVATKAAPPARFSVGLTIDVCLKAPPVERCESPLSRRVEDSRIGVLILRARHCGSETYVPERLQACGRAIPPYPLDLDVSLRDVQKLLADAKYNPAEPEDPDCAPASLRRVKHIEQVATILDATALQDSRAVVFPPGYGLEPRFVASLDGAGSVLVVWNRTTNSGNERHPGVLTPRMSIPRFRMVMSRVRDSVGPGSLLSAHLLPDGEHIAAAWGLDKSVVTRADLEVPASHLDAHFDVLAAEGFRPAVVQSASRAANDALLVVSRRAQRRWRTLRRLDALSLERIIRGVHEQNQVVKLLFREREVPELFGCVLGMFDPPNPPRSSVQVGLRGDELQATMTNYARAGWRIVSALSDEGRGATLAWTRDLEADTRFRPRWTPGPSEEQLL